MVGIHPILAHGQFRNTHAAPKFFPPTKDRGFFFFAEAIYLLVTAGTIINFAA